MDFGFSMGYQKSGILVVGAPHGDLNGRVYICTVGDIIKNNTCQKVDIDIEKLTQYSTREHNPSQHYCLGATIAATPDYFLTCAPLWMSSYKTEDPQKFKNVDTNSYGTCFIYNGTAHRYNGLYEQHVEKTIPNRQAFSGGVGWTTLIDDMNNLILIAKIFAKGDISYISQSSPLSPARSLTQRKKSYFTMHTAAYRNVGLALASGRFSISGANETVYAFSMVHNDMTSTVAFLRYAIKDNYFRLIKNVEIVHEAINTMFGAAMRCEDLDDDGFSELLVGAPAQGDDDNAYEVGALHIFTGGELNTIVNANRMRSIIGTKEGSRFGSAIACTDIDGDNFPEVVVSAPYEGLGMGAVYIISGSELNRMLLKGELYKTISLSQLTSTQRIQNKKFKSFGFSLQVIADINENGCKELAVGSPDSTRVVLYRSIPFVKLALSTQLVGEQVVRIKQNNFTVSVIVDVTYPRKPQKILGKIKLMNSIIGDGVNIAEGQETIVIDLSHKEPNYILDVGVIIDNNEPGTYKFSTVIEEESDDIVKSKDFNPSWVTLKPKSLMSSLEIERRCSGESCLPQLNMTLEWSGRSPYTLGSTKSETVTVRFKNEGNSSYAQTCAYLSVSGARVVQFGCPEADGFYKCLLPVPINRDAEHLIEMSLDMSRATSKDQALIVNVTFYKSGCSLNLNFTKLDLIVPYELETDVITINGSSHERVLTDREVLDTTINSIEDAHEYTIENHGKVLWKGITAIVRWKHYPFIKTYKVSLASTISNCMRQDSNIDVTFTCILSLEPHASVKVISTMELSETDIEKHLVGNNVNVSSDLELHLTAIERKGLSLTTFIQYRKVLSLKQNKQLIILIAIIVAILILAIVAFILYKMGFFNRDTKNQLIEEKKEHEIRKSIRRSTMSRKEDNAEGPSNSHTNQIEVVDEPLEPQTKNRHDTQEP
ncbi:unnamed protein product, partial [Iphiclides podalirius]